MTTLSPTGMGVWVPVQRTGGHEPPPAPGVLSQVAPKPALRKMMDSKWMARHPRLAALLGPVADKMLAVDGRIVALIFAAELCLSRGLGYGFIPASKDDPPMGLLSVSHFWLEFYCAAWILAGATCLFLAFSRRRWIGAMVFSALPSFWWASSYFATWVENNDKSWLPCLLYHAVSGMIFWIAWGQPRGGWRGRSHLAVSAPH